MQGTSSSTVDMIAWLNDNTMKLLRSISTAYQQEMMSLLYSMKGHKALRLSFQELIYNIPPNGIRPTVLATKLNIRKQNIVQLLKQAESAGYIRRINDPRDLRAQLILLSKNGERLVQDGIEITQVIDQKIYAVIGDQSFNNLQKHVLALSSQAKYKAPLLQVENGSLFIHHLIGICDGLSSDVAQRLKTSKFDDYRPQFLLVLECISPMGTKIQTIAQKSDISKQAVSKIIAEMEHSGYVRLIISPEDKRGKIIYLTPQGENLIKVLYEETEEALKAQFSRLSKRAASELDNTLQVLAKNIFGINQYSSHTECQLQKIIDTLRQIDKRQGKDSPSCLVSDKNNDHLLVIDEGLIKKLREIRVHSKNGKIAFTKKGAPK